MFNRRLSVIRSSVSGASENSRNNMSVVLGRVNSYQDLHKHGSNLNVGKDLNASIHSIAEIMKLDNLP